MSQLQTNTPDDIVTLIFNAYKDTLGEHEVDGMSCNPASPLWALRLVCKNWNILATTVSSLWQDVHVRLRVDEAAGIARDTRVLQDWIGLAGTRPLNLYLLAEEDLQSDEQLLRLSAIFDIIVQNSGRWSSINLAVGSRVFPYLEGMQDQLDTLASLSLETSGVVFQEIETFHCAPKLTNVVLTGIDVDMIVLPYPQLTRFVGGALCMIEPASSWLAPLSNLTWASFTSAADDYEPATNTDPITFPALDHLEVAYNDLLAHIDAPLLTSLVIVGPPDSEEAAMFKAFVRRSRIQSFTMKGWSGDPGVLRALPQTVNHLSLSGLMYSNSEVRVLCQFLAVEAGQSKMVLPNLTFLELWVPEIRAAASPSLLAMATSRSAALKCAANKALLRLRIFYRTHDADVSLRELDALKAVVDLELIFLGRSHYTSWTRTRRIPLVITSDRGVEFGGSREESD